MLPRIKEVVQIFRNVLTIFRCLLYDSLAPARIKETVFKRSAARRPVVVRCLLGVEAVSKSEINGFSDREFLTNSDVWSSDRIERTVCYCWRHLHRRT